MQRKIISLYLGFMFLIFPLYYRNNYIDILRAKKSIYLNVTGILIVLMLLFTLYQKVHEKTEKRKAETVWQNKVLLAAVLLSVIAWCAGLALCPYKVDALYGTSGRYLGYVMLFAGLISMLLTAKYLSWSVGLTWSFVTGTSLVYILQILNEWNIDILGMKGNLLEKQHGVFTGTLGNCNYNAAFDCLALAGGMAFFMVCKEKKSRLVYGSMLFFGFMGAFCCRSDSVFLGIAAVFAVVLWYALGKEEKLVVLWWEIVLFFAAACLTRVLYDVFADHAYKMDGLTLFMLRWEVLVAEVIVVVLSGIFVFYREKQCKSTVNLQKWYLWAVLVLLAGMVCLIAAVNLLNWGFLEEGLPGKLKIDDAWGTYRGYVWIRSLSIYNGFPPGNKLFGCGANTLSYLLNEQYGQEMTELFHAKFIDAHNEYLQSLLTTGIVGTVGYFGMILFPAVQSVRQIGDNENALFVVAGTAAFLAQAFVNNTQVVTLPFVFIQTGIFLSVIRTKKHIPG